MKLKIFNTKAYERDFFINATRQRYELEFIQEKLSITTVALASGTKVICCFVTDDLNRVVIKKLANLGIELILLRSAGYDHVDLQAAKECGITVMRVPKYSPESVAEFAVGLILALSRHLVTAYLNSLENNFLLDDLLGFNLYQKTIGIIGTGHIGTAFAKIMRGFGCRLLASDPTPNSDCIELGVTYTTLSELFAQSDIVSLHCLLNDQTHHLINAAAISLMKPGVMIINTGRGGLIDTKALLQGLKSLKIAAAGLDVYEKENEIFFCNHHHNLITDTDFLELQALPNVLITPHQAFLTQESMVNIAQTTIANLDGFLSGEKKNLVV